MINVTTRIQFLDEAKKLLPENPVCCEIGVLKGEFSKLIHWQLEPAILFLIDPFQIGYDKNGKQFTYSDGVPTAYSNLTDLAEVATRFRDCEEVHVIEKFSYDAVSLFPNNHFDFIYIDACHLYDCVEADLKDYLPKLKQGGLMCGHDYGATAHTGVKQAIDEFITEHNFEMIILSNEGDFALKRN